MELDAGIAIQIGNIVDEKMQPMHKRMDKAAAPKPIRRRFGGSGIATTGQITNVPTFPICAEGRMWVVRIIRLFGVDTHTPINAANPTPAQPAVPASTVAVQNTNSYPVSVVISGGTITAVVVNGITVGTAAGTYLVPSGGAISITYSVAPTWVWNYAGVQQLATADIFAGSMQDLNTSDYQAAIASAVNAPFVMDKGNRHITLYAQDQVYALVTGALTGQLIVLTGEADEYAIEEVETVTIKGRDVKPL